MSGFSVIFRLSRFFSPSYLYVIPCSQVKITELSFLNSTAKVAYEYLTDKSHMRYLGIIKKTFLDSEVAEWLRRWT